ncbi:ROK family protein [Aestuariivivens insulae]|uniref:ROK family protein n=1 Tax=Aestuariivivens insulae TaxID=1621988 RepID=UPI001F585407|nr:ROK family protein [Aestuariivivens insulae]
MGAVGIGIDIGGTMIKYGLVDIQGQLVWASEKPTEANVSKERVITNVLEAVNEVLRASESKGLNVKSVGIGSPGLVNDSSVILGGADNIKDWKHVALGEIVSGKTNLFTKVCNDADAMAMAEFKLNCNENDTVVFITLGTGIGGAIFINGTPFQGHYGLGGELGVLPIIVGETHCYWEDIASTSALVKLYKKKLGTDIALPNINGKYIVDQYQKGDKIAKKTLQIFIDYVAMGLAGYVNIFNPKAIIIGGGLSESEVNFMEDIKKQVEKYAIKECFYGVDILPARLGNQAGLIGAALNGLDQYNKVLV